MRSPWLKDDAVFEGWLMRIAINECKNVLRRKKRMPTAELNERLPAINSIPDLSLYDALQKLDVGLRLPVVLHKSRDTPFRRLRTSWGSR